MAIWTSRIRSKAAQNAFLLERLEHILHREFHVGVLLLRVCALSIQQYLPDLQVDASNRASMHTLLG
jgi:hypothetical protein